MLSKEDIALARQQLSEQIESLPDSMQKESARQQLASMSDEAISAMVEQQRTRQQKGEIREQRSVFRMIVDGTIQSRKVDENKEAIAVVSIRPVSKGHIIVIPKKLARDSNELPPESLSLAKKVAARAVSKLKCRGTEIQTSRAFDEVIVNVIPIYEKKVDVNSPPYEVEEEELNEIYNLLKIIKKPRKEIIKKAVKKSEENNVIKLPRRIP